MEITKIRAAGIRLDEHGRAVLGDDLLDAIGQHDVGVALAGGTNPNCNNSGCTNDGCSSISQTNTGCTNNGCDGPMNTRCQNQNDVGGG